MHSNWHQDGTDGSLSTGTPSDRLGFRRLASGPMAAVTVVVTVT